MLKRLQYRTKLIEEGASQKEIRQFDQLTQEQFELWAYWQEH